MAISGIETSSAVNALNLLGLAQSKTAESKDVNEVSDSFSESGETSKFKEIVKKYDITNMSRNEANSMYKELYDNGLIQLKDLATSIAIDPTGIPGWQDGVSSINGWKMSSNPDQKMNYLDGLRIQADWNRIHGDAQFQSNYDKMLELAEKIHYFES